MDGQEHRREQLHGGAAADGGEDGEGQACCQSGDHLVALLEGV